MSSFAISIDFTEAISEKIQMKLIQFPDRFKLDSMRTRLFQYLRPSCRDEWVVTYLDLIGDQEL